MTGDTDMTAARRAAMAAFAAATPHELTAALSRFRDAGAAVDLKPAEVGLVMLRGRMGGDGAPFNVGEATVARSVIRLPSGRIGYGQRLGRDTGAARAAAVLDALWQDPGRRREVESVLIVPVQRRLAEARAAADARTAATRVEFFTLAREAT